MDPFTISSYDILGLSNPPSGPTGSDQMQAPALPANTPAPSDAPGMLDAATLARGAQVTAAPVWRWPTFGALGLMALGVVTIGVASKVASDV